MMTSPIRSLHILFAITAYCAAMVFSLPASAQTGKAAVVMSMTQAPDLDLSIHYYTRVITREGVPRESRYEEKMLRRAEHVWVARVLTKDADGGHSEHEGIKKAALAKPETSAREHKHFNHVVLPRHVSRDGNKMRVEFVDAHDRTAIFIAPSEYENVNFDGSWTNTYYLVDPQLVAVLPLSNMASPVTSARWREREKNGLFQRILWDDKKMIPLFVESGDRAGTFYRRMEVKPQAALSKELPWQKLKGYAQKEYSDFLD